MDTVYEQISILRAGRTLAGLSQDELAARAGVSRQVIVRIESGGANVPIGHLEKVRSALEASGVVFIHSTHAHGPAVAMRRFSNP